MRDCILLLIFLFFSSSISAQKDLDINYKLRGSIYASSSIIDSTALGGFGKSDNTPKSIDDLDFVEKGFFLKVDTSNIISINKKINGYKLFIVNKSDSIIELLASDSRLSVVAQAYINNKWQDIEYLPSSWCGNSFHMVSIKPGEFWEFDIPKFSGKLKTKIRYKLSYGKNQKTYLYSNEIVASVNRNQLKVNEKYESQGLMDPYDD